MKKKIYISPITYPVKVERSSSMQKFSVQVKTETNDELIIDGGDGDASEGL